MGFQDVSIAEKDNSQEIVRGWKLGQGTEKMVLSAYIKAKKPEELKRIPMSDNRDKCGCNAKPAEPTDYITDNGSPTKLAGLSKGLAHPARVEIVRMLANMPPDERCICGDIVNALPLSQSSVSQHLKILKETGWIQGEIDGPRVCYCIVEGIVETYERLVARVIQKGG